MRRATRADMHSCPKTASSLHTPARHTSATLDLRRGFRIAPTQSINRPAPTVHRQKVEPHHGRRRLPRPPGGLANCVAPAEPSRGGARSLMETQFKNAPGRNAPAARTGCTLWSHARGLHAPGLHAPKLQTPVASSVARSRDARSGGCTICLHAPVAPFRCSFRLNDHSSERAR